MPEEYLVLTDEQAKSINSSAGPIVVCKPDGSKIGLLTPNRMQGADDEEPVLSAEQQAEIVRRMCQENIEWRTTAQVLERLDQLKKARSVDFNPHARPCRVG
jgi:hypothetical protein